MNLKVLHNIRLFDARTPHLRDGWVVVVRDDRIEAIEAEDAVARFPDAERIDGQGLTLMPGLIDMHVQIGIPFIRRVNLSVLLQLDTQLANNLRWVLETGVTTVRDMAGIPGVLTKQLRAVASGRWKGPEIFRANSFISCWGGYPDMAPHFNPIQRFFLGGQFAERVRTPEEARAAVRRMADLGSDWIKTGHSDRSYFAGRGALPTPPRAVHEALVDEAHRLGKPVALHQTWLNGFRAGLDLGVDTLEHLPADGEIPDAWLDEMLRKKIAVVPTIYVPVAYVDLKNTERILDASAPYFAPEPMRQTRRLLELLKRPNLTEADLARDCLINVGMLRRSLDEGGSLFANLRKLHQAGVPLGCGSDGGGELIFFGTMQEEMKLMTKAGLSNFEALQSGTLVNARILRQEDRLGSIEPGKQADLIAVEGNPLEDLDALTQVRLVMKAGKIEMNRMPASPLGHRLEARQRSRVPLRSADSVTTS